MYRILSAHSSNALEDKMNESAREGWKLVAGTYNITKQDIFTIHSVIMEAK